MAYIGSIPADQTTGARPRDEFTADGTQITFPLSQGVPGSFETNALVVVNNVVQQPVDAFIIINTHSLTLTSISGTFVLNETVTGSSSSATGKVIKVNVGSIVVETISGTFSSSEGITGSTSSATATTTAADQNFGGGLKFTETPEAASFIYVIHQGQATYNLVPAAGSVGVTQLDPVLRNFTVDEFTGNGSTVAFSLSDTPLTANSVLVVVDGIVQTRTTNYTVSGNTLTFTSAPDTASEIQVIHLGFSAGIKTVPDNSIVTGKIANSAVTTAKINDSAVTTAKINDSAVTNAKLAADGFDASKFTTGTLPIARIADGAVTASKLASTLDLTGKTVTLPADAVSVSGVAATTTTGASVLFKEGTDNGTNYVALKAPDSISTDITWTLPNIDGTNGQVLSTNGSGALSFVTAAGGSGSSITVGDSSVVITDTGSNGKITGTADATEVFSVEKGKTFVLQGGVSSTGVGIAFPADQTTVGASSNANTLDDYEEGTWTPAWSAAGTTFTYYSGNSQVGRYVKVGGLVTAYCYIAISAVSGTKGAVTLTGLPFTLANVANSYVPTWIGQIYNVDWPATAKQLFAYADPNTTVIAFYWSQDDDVQLNLTGAQLESGNTGIMVGISYRV